MATTGKVIALIKGLAVAQGSAITATTVSGTTMTASTALIVGAATTSGIRLDLGASNELEVREGDDSAYAPLNAGTILTDTALIVGAATTSGVRLDLESGVLACREGDDSAYASLGALAIGVGSTQDVGLSRDSANVAKICTQPSSGNGIGMLISRHYVVNLTGDNGASTININALYTNSGASGEVILSLPTATQGCQVKVCVIAAQYFRLKANTGDNIIHLGSTSATAGYIRSNVVGNYVELICMDTTSWVTVSHYGTWTIDS